MRRNKVKDNDVVVPARWMDRLARGCQAVEVSLGELMTHRRVCEGWTCSTARVPCRSESEEGGEKPRTGAWWTCNFFFLSWRRFRKEIHGNVVDSTRVGRTGDHEIELALQKLETGW